ncbi:Transcriptional regulatory protein [Yarrowia sp. E02]|nr:Transcriptional regulatory protein [Yarrowia sp. E02]
MKGYNTRSSSRRAQDKTVGLYPGLNDFTDALEALPLETVRHFTLLREIDAKCTTTTPLVADLIAKFLAIPPAAKDDPECAKKTEDRENMLLEIRGLIRELMPCLEEKMHVAGVAAEAVARHILRIDADYDLITSREIPQVIQYGEPDHPAIIVDVKPSVAERSAQSQRSESRREAIAAKKAAAAAAAEKSGNGGRRGTPSKDGGKDSGKETGGKKTAASNGASGAGAGAKKTGEKRSAASSSVADSVSSSASAAGAKKRKTTAKASPAPGNRKSPPSSDDMPAASATRSARLVNKSRKGQEAAESAKAAEEEDDDGEPVYCYCEQVSYGEMVACDGPQCSREWFHLPCLGLSSPPKGNWYCDECKQGRKR